MKRINSKIHLAIAVCVCFQACSLQTFWNDPESTSEPAVHTVAGKATASSQPLAWWESFADPALNQVMEAVLESNADLAVAAARVEQARARARIADAVRLPAFSATAGVNDLDLPTNAGIGAQLDELGLGERLADQFGLALPDRLGLTTYSFSAQFAWEADFWGRNRNLRLAAGAGQLASESDFHAAQISVLAETIDTYLELVDLRRQRELALDTIDLLTESDELAELRYETGLAEASERYAARRALSEARARLPELETGLAEAESRLWILLGGYREDIAGLLPGSLSLAGASEPGQQGIPAELLAQRPDVAGARQRMEAARFALGAREAELLPALSLSGSIGLQATEAGDWFDPDQWFRNLGVNLLGPALQGSRLRDNVALAEARLREAAALYRQSVVTAVHEVEAALAVFAAGRRRHDVLLAYANDAEAESDLQAQRYAAGIGSYGEVLLAGQVRAGAQAVLSTAERDLGLARLAVHRAFGGAWTAELTRSDGVQAAPLDAIADNANE